MNTLEMHKTESQTQWQPGIQVGICSTNWWAQKASVVTTPSLCGKEAQKNLEAKAVNIGINDNFAFDFNKTWMAVL